MADCWSPPFHFLNKANYASSLVRFSLRRVEDIAPFLQSMVFCLTIRYIQYCSSTKYIILIFRFLFVTVSSSVVWVLILDSTSCENEQSGKQLELCRKNRNLVSTRKCFTTTLNFALIVPHRVRHESREQFWLSCAELSLDHSQRLLLVFTYE